MNVTYTPHHLILSSGYVQSTIPEEFRNAILEEIKEVYESKDAPINSKLVGQIETEQGLNKMTSNERFKDYLKALTYAYDENFSDVTESINRFKKMTSNDSSDEDRDIDGLVWANYQKKHEYNPPHIHSGSYSFVSWIKIPYNLDDELKIYDKSAFTYHSCFHFQFINYDDMSITIEPLMIDKGWEWEIIVFPSNRTHFVNPFTTSDEYRISIAGNLSVDIKKPPEGG